MSAGQLLFSWFIQALTVGIGWVVVHKLSAARDRDKARREMLAKALDGIADSLSEIHEAARNYHLSEREPKDELKLKNSLQDFSMCIIGLGNICDNKAALARSNRDAGALRRAITGEHFEDEHTEVLDSGDPQMQIIAEAYLNAKRNLLGLKYAQFPLTIT